MKQACLAVGWLVCLATFDAVAERPSQPLVSEALPEPLVDSTWLVPRLSNEDFRILELGKRESYEVGHLPQAQFVHWVEDITDPAESERYNILPREQLEQLLSRLGVEKDTMIVLYDKLGNRLATRMFWSLKFYGHQRLRILDGGANAWIRAGQPIVTDAPKVVATDYRVERLDTNQKVGLSFIKNRLTERGTTLVDGRPAEQYSGEVPGRVYHTGKEHARRGHIPRAVNIPWQENLTPLGTFKSVSELRKLYNAAGLAEEATIVTYCNEGLHAAHPWFVLSELLGYRDVRLYDDSLAEWANLPDEALVVGWKP